MVKHLSQGPRALLSLAALIALALAAPRAAAYVFYLTDAGDPLRWKRDTTTVRVSTVEPDDITLAELEAALDEAFLAWDDSGCTPGVTRAGRSDATEGSLPPSTRGPADNVVVFIETAKHWADNDHGRLEIAVTIIANNPKTGEIVDADIEINDAGFAFSMSDVTPVGHIDLRSTITHEVGHFFGLDHSADEAATMYASYDAVDPTAKRSLHGDDLDGVCALYAIPFPPPDDCAAGGAWALPAWLAALMVTLARRVRAQRRG